METMNLLKCSECNKTDCLLYLDYNIKEDKYDLVVNRYEDKLKYDLVINKYKNFLMCENCIDETEEKDIYFVEKKINSMSDYPEYDSEVLRICNICQSYQIIPGPRSMQEPEICGIEYNDGYEQYCSNCTKKYIYFCVNEDKEEYGEEDEFEIYYSNKIKILYVEDLVKTYMELKEKTKKT